MTVSFFAFNSTALWRCAFWKSPQKSNISALQLAGNVAVARIAVERQRAKRKVQGLSFFALFILHPWAMLTIATSRKGSGRGHGITTLI
jgi:hypothetical protein